MPLGLAAALGASLALAAGAAPPKTVPFDPHTQVDGAILQVIFGERALFRLDDGGRPVLDAVQKGKLAQAHPAGSVIETFAAPEPGMLAAALDGSAETKTSVLKVWNHTGHAVEFSAEVLVLEGQTLHPVKVTTCPAPPGGVRTQSWPAPIVAVGLTHFRPATAASLARPGCRKGK